MNYGNIKYHDISNGIGIRTSLFVSGCRNNCPGCFNKDAQNFKYGNEFTEEVQDKIIESINDPYHCGISILGGEPMEPENASELIKFVKRFREVYGYTKTIWVYTGYIYENLRDAGDSRSELISLIDVLVDGPFIESKKDISLKFRGSSNQRILDIKNNEDISKRF